MSSGNYPERCGTMHAQLTSIMASAAASATTLERYATDSATRQAVKWFRQIQADCAEAIRQDDERRVLYGL